MGTVSPPESALSKITREHVLSPLETARKRATREYEEVEAERRAYTQFKERVVGIDTVPTSLAQRMSAVRSVDTSGQQSVERVRSAFRATVMSVDHYDELYGESLDEHVAAELSPEVATLVQSEKTTAFTEPAKTILIGAVDRAESQRDLILDTVETEQNSLENSQTALADLLDTYGESRVADRYRPDVEEKLDALAESRQETLRNRPRTTRTDGHDLCQYLYQDANWTYPVLTALTRSRQSLV
jgi:hypothetical protein